MREVVFHLWNLSELSLLGYLQMNRWRCCLREPVMQHCLGSSWPPNVMSDSPEAQPDFRLQQYLVAVMPHCTHSPQICIANNPLVDHNDNSGWHLTMMDVAVFMVSWKFAIDLKTRTRGSNRVHSQCRDIRLCLSGAQAPTGALSRVGQPEWEDGLRSYWLKRLIICEQVHRCCRAEHSKDVCVCQSDALTLKLPFLLPLNRFSTFSEEQRCVVLLPETAS